MARPIPPPDPELPQLADLHGAWIDRVATRDPARIAELLIVPFTVYYDDGYSGRTKPECDRWRRAVMLVTTVAERDELATCIAGTVHHHKPVATSMFALGGNPTHPIGIVPLDPLRNLVDEPVRDELSALAGDHAFVHGDTLSSSDYDFTLAVSRSRARITFLALTSHPGC